jgi:ribosomal protein S24E
MKKNNIKPTGLKGQEKVNRMIELMGQTLIKEGVDRSVIELTKVGPDGKSYGIVRENHEYYIKIAEGTENLTKDSFNYIGGLKNKKEFAYPSYAKAIKHLNYKFKSLDEANGTKSNINVFENDSLVGEHHSIAMDKAFSDTKPMSKDIEKEYIVDKTGEDLSFDNKEGKEKDGFGDNVAEKSFMDELEEVKLSETEERIDQMITGDVEPDVIVSESDVTVSKPLSILRGIEVIDDAIAKATGEYKLDEMSAATELLKKFSKEEVISILEDVTGKKKV